MKTFSFVSIFIVAICSLNILGAQNRYFCTGELLVSTNDRKSTTVSRPVSIPFSLPFLNILSYYEGSFDALGFNPKDNYIYSVEQNTNNIVRLTMFNDFERIGSFDKVDTLVANAGDCNTDGLYMCYDQKSHKVLVFEVVNEFKFIREIKLFWDIKSGINQEFKVKLFDFSFDPNDTKTAYSYHGNYADDNSGPLTTRGNVLKINLDLNDPNLGMVSPVIGIPSYQLTHLGGTVFDANSSLYGFGSSSNIAEPKQNTFFSINAYEGSASPLLSSSFSSDISDGCSCVYALSFTNSVPFSMYCNNDEGEFKIEFVNKSLSTLEKVVLKDTFPEGTIIKSISGDFDGRIDAGTGIGTNLLSISDLTIPVRQIVKIVIELEVVNAKDGLSSNRAYLYNLPLPFPEQLSSDDPNSSTPNDRSNFIFNTRSLTDLSWVVKSPTDCIKANDGILKVKSKNFLPGQKYQIGLRNQVGWGETLREVMVDDNNSFIVDSIIPGKYQLFSFRVLGENCSVKLKDTLITIEAPHNLINLQTSSNSPLCQGDQIFITSSTIPNTSIVWRGPNLFITENPNPVIVTTMGNFSGMYEAQATYGFCKQTKSLEIEVKQAIASSLIGDTSYCIRDTLKLEIKTNQSDVLHTWEFADGKIVSDSLVLFYINSDKASGNFSVISTNGACYDTILKYIKILPSPILPNDTILETDFCNNIILFSGIIDQQNLNYNWNPKEGLSCYDCPDPRLIPIVKSNYQLFVENEHNCVDSMNFIIKLDFENILFTPNIISLSSLLIANREFRIVPNCNVNSIQKLDIFDRFGNVMFSSNSIVNGFEFWDGKSLGKSVSPGVYIWIAKVELVNGDLVYLKGDITVI